MIISQRSLSHITVNILELVFLGKARHRSKPAGHSVLHRKRHQQGLNSNRLQKLKMSLGRLLPPRLCPGRQEGNPAAGAPERDHALPRCSEQRRFDGAKGRKTAISKACNVSHLEGRSFKGDACSCVPRVSGTRSGVSARGRAAPRDPAAPAAPLRAGGCPGGLLPATQDDGHEGWHQPFQH